MHTKLTIAYTLQQIPIWWRWYYWASLVAWTLYGLVTSQVGDKNASLEIPKVGNLLAWTLYGRVTSQVGDKNASLEIPQAGNSYSKPKLSLRYTFNGTLLASGASSKAFFVTNLRGYMTI